MDNRRVTFGGKVKGLLVAPAKTFNNVQAEALGSALKYFTIWAVIFAILRTVIFYTVERRIFQALWASLVSDNTALFLYHFDPLIKRLTKAPTTASKPNTTGSKWYRDSAALPDTSEVHSA